MFAKYVGISAQTAALIEKFRDSPSQPEDEIIAKVLEKLRQILPTHVQSEVSGQKSENSLSGGVGCDLGMGAVLADGEKMYLFRYRSSLDGKKPDEVAVAKQGKLYIDDKEIKPSRGSWVQPALKMFQIRTGDISPTTGDLVSLDAWEQWYVHRDGQFVRVGDLRDREKIQKRNRHRKISLEDF